MRSFWILAYNEVSESCRKASFWERSDSQTTTAPPLSADLTTVIAFTKIFKRRPLFRGKVGKFSVTIEFKFVNVVTAFFGEKI